MSIRIESKTMPALEALAFIKPHDAKLLIEKWNGKLRHYAFRVTRHGRIITCYGELKSATVTTCDGKLPVAVFGAADFIEYRTHSFTAD